MLAGLVFAEPEEGAQLVQSVWKENTLEVALCRPVKVLAEVVEGLPTVLPAHMLIGVIHIITVAQVWMWFGKKLLGAVN